VTFISHNPLYALRVSPFDENASRGHTVIAMHASRKVQRFILLALLTKDEYPEVSGNNSSIRTAMSTIRSWRADCMLANERKDVEKK